MDLTVYLISITREVRAKTDYERGKRVVNE